MSRRVLLTWLLGLVAVPLASGCGGGDDAGKKKQEGEKQKEKQKVDIP